MNCSHGYSILQDGIDICQICNKPIGFYRRSEYDFLYCYLEHKRWFIWNLRFKWKHK